MIDAHAHIQFEDYDQDRPAMLQRAWEAGLTDIVVIGGEERRNRQALELAASDPRLHAVLGFHPINAGEYTPEMEALLPELLKNENAVAIGEIGLDYHEGQDSVTVQRRTFCAQLEMARRLDLPVVVHSRDAEADTLDVLKDFPGLRGQIHCFSYEAAAAEKFLALGFHISFCGPITFKNGQRQREASQVVPLDRLLVETDCPYMAPTPYRGRRNEPAYVVEIARAHAQLRNMELEELDAALTANARRLFMLK